MTLHRPAYLNGRSRCGVGAFQGLGANRFVKPAQLAWVDADGDLERLHVRQFGDRKVGGDDLRLIGRNRFDARLERTQNRRMLQIVLTLFELRACGFKLRGCFKLEMGNHRPFARELNENTVLTKILLLQHVDGTRRADLVLLEQILGSLVISFVNGQHLLGVGDSGLQVLRFLVMPGQRSFKSLNLGLRLSHTRRVDRRVNLEQHLTFGDDLPLRQMFMDPNEPPTDLRDDIDLFLGPHRSVPENGRRLVGGRNGHDGYVQDAIRVGSTRRRRFGPKQNRANQNAARDDRDGDDDLKAAPQSFHG